MSVWQSKREWSKIVTRERPVQPVSIALCADDYGQHAGIDDAVCAMLAAGHLTAVSCMSGAPRWQTTAAAALRDALAAVAAHAPPAKAPDALLTLTELAEHHAGGADIGLHVNLTEGFGAGARSLPAILLRSYLRLLDKTVLRTTLERQFDAFENAMQRRPDFIDGHQHVHQLPIVRDALLALVERRYDGGARPWIRNTVPANPLWRGKPRVLERLGGGVLHDTLAARALPSNYGFAGVYGFDGDEYPTLFGQWLASAGDGMLIMCHPGSAVADGDPISAARVREFAFFSSGQFPAMLAAYHIRLDRLSSILPRVAAALAQLPSALRETKYLPSQGGH